MMYPGCLTLILVLFLLILLPIFFAQFMLAALAKLGLSAPVAFIILMAIILGSTVNIPIKRLPRDQDIDSDPSVMFGFDRFFPLPRVRRSYVTIAVNVGGCIIPSILAVYEGLLVAQQAQSASGATHRQPRQHRGLLSRGAPPAKGGASHTSAHSAFDRRQFEPAAYPRIRSARRFCRRRPRTLDRRGSPAAKGSCQNRAGGG